MLSGLFRLLKKSKNTCFCTKIYTGSLSAGHASAKEEKNDLFIFTYGCSAGVSPYVFFIVNKYSKVFKAGYRYTLSHDFLIIKKAGELMLSGLFLVGL